MYQTKKDRWSNTSIICKQYLGVMMLVEANRKVILHNYNYRNLNFEQKEEVNEFETNLKI